VEAFNASFTPRLRAVKLGAVGAGYNQFVNNASLQTFSAALRLEQEHIVAVAVASQGHACAPPALTSNNVSLTVVAATNAPEVATYEISAKPIGQWVVGSDLVAATASTTLDVRLQQWLYNLTLGRSDYGFSVTAPDTNQTSTTLGVANATDGHTADPVDCTQHHILVTVSAETGHTVAAPSVTQPSATLGVESASMAHLGPGFFTADAVNIDQSHVLGVANADGVCEVAAPTLFLVPGVPTPAERIFTPANESRVHEVVTESRSFAIAA
jgi:hypothetical protein